MKRPLLYGLLAGFAAVLAAVLVYSALKKSEAEVRRAAAHTVQIVVAAGDLPLGSKIETGSVKLARWSRDAMPPGAFTDPQAAMNAYVKKGFVQNEPIVADKLFTGQKTAGVMPLLIPPGMRAMSVPVDEVSDVAGFVLPHARVDVLVAVSQNDANAKPFSKVVLQNVEVLAVAQEVEKKKDEPELVKVVTLLVTPQEAERLTLASREGTLRLAMRNYNDKAVVLTAGVDVQELQRAYSAAPQIPLVRGQKDFARRNSAPAQAFQVEILRDGKRVEDVSFAATSRQQTLGEDAQPPKSKTAAAAGRVPARSAGAKAPANPEAGHAPQPARAGEPAQTAYDTTSKTIDVP